MRPQRQLTLTFELPLDRCYRLCDVETVLSRVMSSTPSRTTLLNWLDEGRLEGKRMSFGWIVYESSLKAFIDSMQREVAA
jgi:hypothetical protein